MQTNTKMITLDGAVTNGYRIQKKQVVARFTSDELGETLSLEEGSMMIMVPFEQVDKLIKATRRAKK